jgi:hypothetical protein
VRGTRRGRGSAATATVMPARGQPGRGNKRHEKVSCKGVEPWGSSVAASDAWKRDFTGRPPMADLGLRVPAKGWPGLTNKWQCKL